MFPKIGVPQNEWFIMENPIEMDDLGLPLFLETPISLRLFQHTFGTHPEQPLPTGYNRIPFLVGQGDCRLGVRYRGVL